MNRFQLLLLFVIVIALSDDYVSGQEYLPRIPAPLIEVRPTPLVPKLESSTIEIPLIFPLNKMIGDIEERFPKVNLNKNWMVNGWTGLKYKTWRDRLMFTMFGNAATTRANFIYQVKTQKGFKLEPPFQYISRFLFRDQCGSKYQHFGASAYVYTEFTLGNDWGLISKTKYITSFYTINLCPLKFGQQFASDVAMKTSREQMNSVAENINKEIGQIDLRSNAEKAWKILGTPILIDNSDSWLSFNPEAITFSSPKGENNAISTTMGVTVKPRFEMATPIPNQRNLPQLPSADKNHKFGVVEETRFEFDDVSDELEDRLLAQEYKLGSKTVQITGVKLTGRGNEAVIKVRFTGEDIIGTIYLQGQISFDQSTKNLIVRNLDFTNETKETLRDASVDWNNDSSLIRGLESIVKLNLVGELNQATEGINRRINESHYGEGHFVSTLAPGEILQLFAEDDGFVIRFVAEGSLEFQLQ